MAPKLAEYRDYIALEMKDGDPARVQCICERAIKDNCLDPNLWMEYTEYLVCTSRPEKSTSFHKTVPLKSFLRNVLKTWPCCIDFGLRNWHV